MFGGEKKVKLKKTEADIIAKELLAAVENQELEQAELVLASGVVSCNCLSPDGFSPLDIANLTNNLPMARLLVKYGGKENLTRAGDSCLLKLNILITEAQQKVAMFRAVNDKNCEEEMATWTYKTKLFHRMKTGYQHARPPDTPTAVFVMVTSDTSMRVTFAPPVHNNNALITRYQVEASQRKDFLDGVHCRLLTLPCDLECDLCDLERSQSYYVRVRAWNMKGWSEYAYPDVNPSILSSWRQLKDVSCRYKTAQHDLNHIFTEFKLIRPTSDITVAHVSSPSTLRKSTVRRSLKNLFSSPPKFVKHLNRGLYLAVIFAYEDKLLLTSDDLPPIVELEENCSSVSQTISWLYKVACAWDDVRALRSDVERLSNQSTILQTRFKILSTLADLQSSLGTVELGQVYHSVFKDPSTGSVLLVTSNILSDTKHINPPALRWTNTSKLDSQGKEGAVSEMCDKLTSILSYGSASLSPVSSGLYMGYLQVTSSLEQMKICVSERWPNLVPHCKVRDTPHITREEWMCLDAVSQGQKAPPSGSLAEFIDQLVSTAHKLMDQHGVTAASRSSHRLYIDQVLEISPTVCLLLLLPSPEAVCSIDAGNSQSSHAIPLMVFEQMSLRAYRPALSRMFYRLTTHLETEVIVSRHAERAAFSPSELSDARVHSERVQALIGRLDKVQKLLRWSVSLVHWARQKDGSGDLPLTVLSKSRIREISQNSKLREKTFKDGYKSDSPQSDILHLAEQSSNSPQSERSADAGYHSDNSNEPTTAEVTVYSAFPCGLPSSSSVTLQITQDTTAREVLQVVVSQLQQSAAQTGSASSIAQGKQCESEKQTFTGQNYKPNYSDFIQRQTSLQLTNTERRVLDLELQKQYSLDDQSYSRGIGQSQLRDIQNTCRGKTADSVKSLHSGSNSPSSSICTLRRSTRSLPGVPLDQQMHYSNSGALPTHSPLNTPPKSLSRSPSTDFSTLVVVVVCGARERVLRSDFRLMHLREPWSKGQLYIRRKDDLLAALDCAQLVAV